MTWSQLLARAGKMVTDNSPVIMTAVGVSGTLLTAYLTGRASYRAAEILAEERLRRAMEKPRAWDALEPREKIELTWKLYVPAMSSAAVTVTAIVLANRIGTRRAAALAAAYAIAERSFDEYRNKIVEKLGDRKEQSFRDEIAQEHVRKDPPTKEVIIVGGGETLCRDDFSGRYFKSDRETLNRAVNTLNFTLLHDMYASLSDFYNLIGLPRTRVSDDVGWTSNKMLELEISYSGAEDGTPCLVMGFRVEPIRNYYKVN